MEDRVPPHDLGAEQSVLGSMMISKEAAVLMAGALTEDVFYRDGHAHIFKAMVALIEKSEPIDIITVTSELKKMEKLDKVGSKTYLADLVNAVPTASNADYYAAIVKEKAMLRRLIKAGSDIVSDCFDDNQDANDILSSAQRGVMDVGRTSQEKPLIHLKDVVNTAWDKISESYDSENQIMGIPTGFSDLDQLTSGFQKSDLIVLAARPGMGKTTMSLNFALNAAVKHKKAVAYFSLEMPKEQIAIRLLSAEARVSMGRLKTANIAEHEYGNLARALGNLSEAPIYIDDTPGMNPLSMRAKCNRLMIDTPIDLVVIDYLQLMKMGKKRVESRYHEVSEIVREVKTLARELNVPIIALSQLSRDVEKRNDEGGPKLSDLRETGEIEQTADLVMFIYKDADTDSKLSPTYLSIAKHRNGPTGKIDLQFRKEVMRFEQTYVGPVADS